MDTSQQYLQHHDGPLVRLAPARYPEVTTCPTFDQGVIMTTVPATDFNRNPSYVKRLAADGPVVVTERDRPTLVVLTYEDYEKITSAPSGFGTLLQMDEDIDIDFEEMGIGIEPEDFG